MSPQAEQQPIRMSYTEQDLLWCIAIKQRIPQVKIGRPDGSQGKYDVWLTLRDMRAMHAALMEVTPTDLAIDLPHQLELPV